MKTRSCSDAINLSSILSSTDFYYILGCDHGATKEEIRKAFLRRSLKVHPDKHTGEARNTATKAFVKLKDAYDTLFDGKQREQYDAKCRRSNRATGGTAGTGSAPRSQGHNYHNNNTSGSRSGYYQNSEGWDQWWQDQEAQRKQRQQQEEQRRQEKQREEWKRQQEHVRRQQERARKEEQRRQQEQQERTRQEELRRQQERQKREELHRQEELRRQERKREELRRQEEARLREKLRRQQEEQRRHREQKQQAQWEPPKQQKTFGTTQNGEFCKRCIQQGDFCWQHEFQDPLYNDEQQQQPGVNRSSQRHSSCHDNCRGHPHHHHHFGINKSNGEPCKKCIKMQGFCHHHKDQDPKYTHRAEPRQQRASTTQSSAKPQYVPFGRCKNGQSCKLCEKKGGFCHHHRRQAV